MNESTMGGGGVSTAHLHKFRMQMRAAGAGSGLINIQRLSNVKLQPPAPKQLNCIQRFDDLFIRIITINHHLGAALPNLAVDLIETEASVADWCLN